MAERPGRRSGAAPLVPAARLYGLISAQTVVLAQVLADPLDRRVYAAGEAALTTHRAAAARQQALAAGQAMSLEQAVAAALA